jgi:glutathione-specific gamma-glutamylcyclotransferase
MWDGWESPRECVCRALASLKGYQRIFNKASVKNWGTKEFPGPTLNLMRSDSAHCHGMAFEFLDEREQQIKKYLAQREGKGFALKQLPAQLEAGAEIIAIVPIYEGNNLIRADRIEEIAKQALRAVGDDGKCIDYVEGVAAKLHGLGIDDPAVSDLLQAVRFLQQNTRTANPQRPQGEPLLWPNPIFPMILKLRRVTRSDAGRS